MTLLLKKLFGSAPGVAKKINMKSEFLAPELKEVSLKREVIIPRTTQGYEEKSFIYFDIDGKEVSLLTRKIETFCLPTLIGFNLDKDIAPADTYFKTISILKELGFTTVADVWKMADNKVATTNLVEFGGSVYDQKIDADLVRDTLDMDKEFVKIPFDQVQKNAQELVNLANKKGVELMTDGPFHLVIKPDTSWYILPLDVGKIRIHANAKELSGANKHDNQFYVDKAVRAFSQIQQNIKALRVARGLPR